MARFTVMCIGNQHTFTWGSSTAVDAMPLSLRCECGAMSHEDIAPLRQLQAETARLADELAFQTQNATNAHVSRAEQFRRAADALEDNDRLLAKHVDLIAENKRLSDALMVIRNITIAAEAIRRHVDGPESTYRLAVRHIREASEEAIDPRQGAR